MELSLNTLTDLLTQQVILLQELQQTEMANRLLAAQRRLTDAKLQVLIAGEYSRGKTTLLNALIGQEILATSALPVRTSNRISYAATPVAYIKQDQDWQAVALESLIEGDYAQVRLTFPLDLCQDDVELFECPTMSEQPDSFATAIADSDAVVVVLASDALYSATESRMIEQIKQGGHEDLLFICNFMDRIPSSQVDAIMQAARVRLPVNPDRILFVSAGWALEGVDDGLAMMAQVRSTFVHLFGSNRGSWKERRAKRLMQESMRLAQEQVAQHEAGVASQAAAAATLARDLYTAFEATQTAKRNITGSVEAFRQRTREVVQTMTGSFVRNLGLELETWIKTYDGSALANDVQKKAATAIRTWHQTVLQPYLHEQTQREFTTLKNGVNSFHNALQQLYTLANQPFTDQEWTLTIPEFSLDPIDLPLQATQPQSESKTFSLREMPEVMLTLAASAIAFLLLPIFAVPISLAGVGAAVYLGLNKQRATGKSARNAIAEAYAKQVRSRADQMTLEIWGDVDQHLDRAVSQVMDYLNRQTTQAESLYQTVFSRAQVDMQTSADSNLRQRLVKIQETVISLSSL